MYIGNNIQTWLHFEIAPCILSKSFRNRSESRPQTLENSFRTSSPAQGISLQFIYKLPLESPLEISPIISLDKFHGFSKKNLSKSKTKIK